MLLLFGALHQVVRSPSFICSNLRVIAQLGKTMLRSCHQRAFCEITVGRNPANTTGFLKPHPTPRDPLNRLLISYWRTAVSSVWSVGKRQLIKHYFWPCCIASELCALCIRSIYGCSNLSIVVGPAARTACGRCHTMAQENWLDRCLSRSAFYLQSLAWRRLAVNRWSRSYPLFSSPWR